MIGKWNPKLPGLDTSLGTSLLETLQLVKGTCNNRVTGSISTSDNQAAERFMAHHLFGL
jgi:hypothetical protein